MFLSHMIFVVVALLSMQSKKALGFVDYKLFWVISL